MFWTDWERSGPLLLYVAKLQLLPNDDPKVGYYFFFTLAAQLLFSNFRLVLCVVHSKPFLAAVGQNRQLCMMLTSRFAWDLHKARKLHKDNKGHQGAIFNANHAIGRNIKRETFFTYPLTVELEMFHAVRKTFPLSALEAVMTNIRSFLSPDGVLALGLLSSAMSWALER